MAKAYLRYAMAALLCAPFAFACGSDDKHNGDARVLDTACSKTAPGTFDPHAVQPTSGCYLSDKGAKKVSGLTSDSIGLRLGPEEGTVTIVVPPLTLPNNDDTWTYEILARGTGSFEVPSCEIGSSTSDAGSETGAERDPYASDPTCLSSATPTGTFEWIPVGAEGRLTSSSTRGVTVTTPLAFKVRAGSTLEIVDIRIVSSESPKGGCG